MAFNLQKAREVHADLLRAASDEKSTEEDRAAALELADEVKGDIDANYKPMGTTEASTRMVAEGLVPGAAATFAPAGETIGELLPQPGRDKDIDKANAAIVADMRKRGIPEATINKVIGGLTRGADIPSPGLRTFERAQESNISDLATAEAENPMASKGIAFGTFMANAGRSGVTRLASGGAARLASSPFAQRLMRGAAGGAAGGAYAGAVGAGGRGAETGDVAKETATGAALGAPAGAIGGAVSTSGLPLRAATSTASGAAGGVAGESLRGGDKYGEAAVEGALFGLGSELVAGGPGAAGRLATRPNTDEGQAYAAQRKIGMRGTDILLNRLPGDLGTRQKTRTPSQLKHDVAAEEGAKVAADLDKVSTAAAEAVRVAEETSPYKDVPVPEREFAPMREAIGKLRGESTTPAGHKLPTESTRTHSLASKIDALLNGDKVNFVIEDLVPAPGTKDTSVRPLSKGMREYFLGEKTLPGNGPQDAPAGPVTGAKTGAGGADVDPNAAAQKAVDVLNEIAGQAYGPKESPGFVLHGGGDEPAPSRMVPRSRDVSVRIPPRITLSNLLRMKRALADIINYGEGNERPNKDLVGLERSIDAVIKKVDKPLGAAIEAAHKTFTETSDVNTKLAGAQRPTIGDVRSSEMSALESSLLSEGKGGAADQYIDKASNLSGDVGGRVDRVKAAKAAETLRFGLGDNPTAGIWQILGRNARTIGARVLAPAGETYERFTGGSAPAAPMSIFMARKGKKKKDKKEE